MRALLLNATLKPSPEPSSTGALAGYVGEQLGKLGVEVEHVRLADHVIEPGVVSEAVREGDEWPALHERVLAADIVVFGTPTWLGQPSSIDQARARAPGRDAVGDRRRRRRRSRTTRSRASSSSATRTARTTASAEMAGAAIDLGFTVPGQAWTYWNKGPGPGEEEYLTTDDREWTHSTGDAMAHVLVAHGDARSPRRRSRSRRTPETRATAGEPARVSLPDLPQEAQDGGRGGRSPGRRWWAGSPS